ncbi:MAG: phosphoenolpyruvate synthase [Candidatus Woesearchaeota archaeon]|nr:phosphoenolpyruvate synthase [Candidatus Woesearchaeota archaeon]
MPNILWFKDISKNDVPIVGGKGASLGEMYNANLPVPPGFCITVDAYKKFLHDAGIDDPIYKLLNSLDVENQEALNQASEKVQDLILESEMPDSIKKDITYAYNNLNVDMEVFKLATKETIDLIKSGRDLPYVAVRSSATAEDTAEASFAGQNITYLNIKGSEEVVKAVRKCWASLFTPRSIYYRVKNNFDHSKVFISVIIQKMVNSYASGVMFTINPSTNNENEIMIDAGLGLGEAVVSGSITPDEYLVDKNTLQIKEKKINKQEWLLTRDMNLGKTIKKTVFNSEQEKQKINDADIIKLARYAKQIEDHYKSQQDIEYAIENNKIYIVQSRPVTALKIEKQEVKQDFKDKEVILQGLAASPHVGSGPVKIVNNINDLIKIQKGDILVAKMTNPDYVTAMKKVNGIITDEGGTTCHAAIVGRELGVPVVVGTQHATKVLKENDLVTVDGVNGKVYKGRLEISQPIQEEKEKIIEENIQTVTEVKVNIDMPDLIEEAIKTNADGVGLLRCEFMLSKNKEHPSYLIKNGRKNELVNILYNDIIKIAQAFKNKPVWYRTSDFRTDEYKDLIGGNDEPVEENPMLGWHGIRRSLDQPEFLKAEFEAIKKVHDSGFTNVGVMLPMVISVDEIKKAKELLNEVGLEPLEEIEFGIMIETPAAVQIIKEICEEGIDFISIGSNDLTQFTLALDRNNANVQDLFSELHPAVLRQITHVIRVCHEYNVETSICGQAGSNEEMAEFLVKSGIDSISANIDAVSKIRRTVAKVEKKLLLGVARKDFSYL